MHAWRHDDAAAIDSVTTKTAQDELLARPFPSPAPVLVNCERDTRVPGAQGCLFSSGVQNFTLVAEPNADGSGWVIARARFLM
jgi:hypothetical protein